MQETIRVGPRSARVYLGRMLIAWVPLIAVIVGLLLWALASKPLVQRCGEILFFCGTLVSLMSLAGTTVNLLHR